MKSIAVFIVLMFFGTLSAQVSTDKQLHVLAGYSIGWSTQLFTKNMKPEDQLGIAWLSGYFVGFAKEVVLDHWIQKEPVDWWDAAFTAGGSGAAGITIFIMNGNKEQKKEYYLPDGSRLISKKGNLRIVR